MAEDECTGNKLNKVEIVCVGCKPPGYLAGKQRLFFLVYTNGMATLLTPT